eukprot:12532574-Alexandrium_andersonii.AAC.1
MRIEHSDKHNEAAQHDGGRVWSSVSATRDERKEPSPPPRAGTSIEAATDAFGTRPEAEHGGATTRSDSAAARAQPSDPA